MHQGGPCGMGPASLSSAQEAVVRSQHKQAYGAGIACAVHASSLWPLLVET